MTDGRSDSDIQPNDDDQDPANVVFRAGYIHACALKLPANSEDRTMLLRASRSLIAYARSMGYQLK